MVPDGLLDRTDGKPAVVVVSDQLTNGIAQAHPFAPAQQPPMEQRQGAGAGHGPAAAAAPQPGFGAAGYQGQNVEKWLAKLNPATIIVFAGLPAGLLVAYGLSCLFRAGSKTGDLAVEPDGKRQAATESRVALLQDVSRPTSRQVSSAVALDDLDPETVRRTMSDPAVGSKLRKCLSMETERLLGSRRESFGESFREARALE